MIWKRILTQKLNVVSLYEKEVCCHFHSQGIMHQLLQHDNPFLPGIHEKFIHSSNANLSHYSSAMTRFSFLEARLSTKLISAANFDIFLKSLIFLDFSLNLLGSSYIQILVVKIYIPSYISATTLFWLHSNKTRLFFINSSQESVKGPMFQLPIYFLVDLKGWEIKDYGTQ